MSIHLHQKIGPDYCKSSNNIVKISRVKIFKNYFLWFSVRFILEMFNFHFYFSVWQNNQILKAVLFVFGQMVQIPHTNKHFVHGPLTDQNCVNQTFRTRDLNWLHWSSIRLRNSIPGAGKNKRSLVFKQNSETGFSFLKNPK